MTGMFDKTFYRPIVFQEIDRIAWPPSWLGHTPFALWLMEELKPRTFVELGTHTGNSFSAFCQAAKILGYSPACYAIDTWEGDPHAGIYGESVYEEFKEYATRIFGSFAQLIRSTFNQALTNFTDGSIDLLNIDGYHTYEATRENFENWLPKMSARGVILIHDTNVHTGDFGAWKFWDEIKVKYPSFAFLHSHGLGVAFVGSEISPGLKWMTDSARSPQEISQIASFFSALGNSPVLRSTNQKLMADIAALEGKAKANETTSITVLQEERATRAILEQNLRQQAAKISSLLAELESQGSLYTERVDKLARQLEVSSEASHWKQMGQARLGPTLDVANHQIDLLYSYVRAMGSPAHRATSFISRRLGSSFLKRSIRRALNFAMVVKQA